MVHQIRIRVPRASIAERRVAMIIANPKQKMLVSAAFVLGSCVLVAAPANADPNPSGTQPNPFAGLTCSCQKAPVGGPVPTAELDRGIRNALSAP
jgi:hypothetical protein